MTKPEFVGLKEPRPYGKNVLNQIEEKNRSKKVDWMSEIEEWKPAIGDHCFYFSTYQNICNMFKTKILAKSEKPDCFDIQSERPMNDYSGRYLIVPNVHKSNLCKLENLLIQIKMWGVK